jgi:CubicO group peptidase (beta-lactamase class C family)
MKIKLTYPILTLSFAVVVGVALAPPTHALSAPSAGNDAALQAAVQAQFGSQYNNLSVAKIDANAGTVKYANFGASNSSEYEIGSVSKTMVGLMMADAISRGEVTENTTVGSKLPIASNLAPSSLTLRELATHRSGLPSLPSTYDMQIQVFYYQTLGGNLVPFTLNQMLTQTRSTSVTNRGTYKYSNLGASLEGHMLATAANTNFKSLMQDRLLTPLGLTQTRFLSATGDVTSATTRGKNANNSTMAPFAGEGYAPAATARSTVGDMAKYALKVMKGEVPGVSALTPRVSAAPGQQVGYNWFIDSNGRQWHNGLTGGFASMFMLNPNTGKGIVVLSNKAVIVDNGAIALLENPAI